MHMIMTPAAKKMTQDKSKSVYIYVGQRIKERRRLLKMNQTQLAQLMGFSYQQMQKYENGMSEISVSKLLRFAQIFNVPPSYFYEGAPTDDLIGSSIHSPIIQKQRSTPLNILLIEDNPSEVILFNNAVQESHDKVNLHILHDAGLMHDYLQNHDSKYGKAMPDVIVLDISLPKISGLQLLKSIKRNTQIQEIPVLMLTNSINRDEMIEAYKCGAAGFIQKSVDLHEYGDAISTAIKYWSKVVSLPRM